MFVWKADRWFVCLSIMSHIIYSTYLNVSVSNNKHLIMQLDLYEEIYQFNVYLALRTVADLACMTLETSWPMKSHAEHSSSATCCDTRLDTPTMISVPSKGRWMQCKWMHMRMHARAHTKLTYTESDCWFIKVGLLSRSPEVQTEVFHIIYCWFFLTGDTEDSIWDFLHMKQRLFCWVVLPFLTCGRQGCFVDNEAFI